ncbi:Maph2 [Matsumuraeses phaseoli granulovirus]|uniref:Maph2 n=1 Tax=Matsumuraeses phaseoli granulovirus TaxID=2760664 RepID=A0AAE7ML86_9BBAC|nr:Maph2 [Matsumuraeses phaseoli granulovirus]QOD39965.1 Maph2 [Matsumuraeses phaseoli granulovirus]
MDLLGFMRNAGFKADARDIINQMKWNVSLKRKLASNFGEDVTLTIDEVIELLETVYNMTLKIRSNKDKMTTSNNSPSLVIQDSVITDFSAPKLISLDSSVSRNNNIKIVCGDKKVAKNSNNTTTNSSSPEKMHHNVASVVHLTDNNEDKVVNTESEV